MKELSIHEKLATMQSSFKSKKSRFNSFGKYYFRSAEDILEAIKPYLLELRVVVTIREDVVDLSGVPVIQSTAKIQNLDSEGDLEPDFIEAYALVGVDLLQKGMQTPQAFGSASSYGKKYALGNLLLIDDTADSDATNNHGKGQLDAKQATKPKPKLEGEALKKAQDAVKAGKFTLEDIKKKYDISPANLKTFK